MNGLCSSSVNEPKKKEKKKKKKSCSLRAEWNRESLAPFVVSIHAETLAHTVTYTRVNRRLSIAGVGYSVFLRPGTKRIASPMCTTSTYTG